MKVIIFASGSDGDIHPHLGIGRELVARGHHVAFITTFNYVDVARECGFEVLSFFDQNEKQDLARSTESLGAIAKIKRYCRSYSAKTAEVCELVAGRLDDQSILIAPPFAYPVARLLHSKYGTPYVSTVLAPVNLLSRRDPPAIKSLQWYSALPYWARKLLFNGTERLLVDPALRMLLKESVRKLDLPMPSRTLSEWGYSPQRVMGLFPDWFSPPPADWPAQITLTGFPLFDPNMGKQTLSAGLSQFLDAGPPPVVFTAGTGTKDPHLFFETALKSVQTLGVRGVFLTRLTDQLPPLPDTVWQEGYTSLNLLLPQSSIFVHHGGSGTAAMALSAGIPQLLVPTEEMGQLDNAHRIERLGCGLVQQNIQQNSLDSSSVTKKLEYLLTAPQVRDACRSAQDRIEPSAKACGRAADVIEETFRSISKIAATA
jgi:rhamnosyltransferase subunit B